MRQGTLNKEKPRTLALARAIEVKKVKSEIIEMIILRVPKKQPRVRFGHSDYNCTPMKLKFQDMSAERIPKLTIPNWELQHSIFYVKNYYKCVKKILEQCRTFFEIDRELYKSVIQDWVSKFETYGTFVNLKKKSSNRSSYSGRPRTRTGEMDLYVVEMVQESANL